MKLLAPLVLALSLLSPSFAQEAANPETVKKHEYQSDVARLRKIVIESLYSHREVFLRELISNANDAIEKLRLTALKDKTVWDGAAPLNITLQLQKDPEGEGGRLVIADTGIGMSPEELTANLGTLAKSGTSEFLAKADDSSSSSGSSSGGNLIGAFGLGFYSSFLVADKVYVSSLPAPSAANPNPVQHVFSSSSDEPSFEVYKDPRGNTLGRGTEITLVLKKDALEYLEEDTVKKLVAKHSGFASSFPIYLFTNRTEKQPIPQDDMDAATEEKPKVDDDEVLIEDTKEKKDEDAEIKTQSVVIEEWVHLNDQPPLWAREPKDVTDDEYKNFYQATFKQHTDPILWHHFKGDSGPVSFKALVFVPESVPEEFWQSAQASSQDTRLMVKRVLITSDFGEHKLPKWISWIKVLIDADDLPLNVSRETLQSTRFLRQIKNIVVTRFIQAMTKVAEEEPERYTGILKSYNQVLKLGVVETAMEGKSSNKDKLAGLTRWDTTLRKGISLQEYVEGRKEGQNQIFFLANIGQTTENMRHSVFVEKLVARGYEVILMTDTMDEVFVSNLRIFNGMPFQDVAKKGLKYGDEDLQQEKKDLEKFKEDYKPLIDFFVKSTNEGVKDVIVSNRLVTSPCAIVVDSFGYSANMEKLLASAGKKNALQDYASKQKVLEINPRSPLIEGLLKRIMALGEEEGERDKEEETELTEVVNILIDGALIRSGFDVMESNIFFERVDHALRRSLGVSETAKTEVIVEPAPPQATGPPMFADKVSMDPNDFVEMKDFRESLKPELERSFGGPKVGDEGEGEAKQIVFDGNYMTGGDQEDMDEIMEEAIKHMEFTVDPLFVNEVKDMMKEKKCAEEQQVGASQMHLASRRGLGSSPVPLCTSIRRTYSQDFQHATLSDSGISSVERSSGKKHKYRSGVASASSQWPGWNLVVGIEVHAQLKTRRKLFSNSLAPEDNHVPANERVSLFDAAFPGTLPTINPVCVALAARTALALHADIQSRSSFDRKHYFYGDLPAGYQITQNYAPFAKGGYLELTKSRKRIRIKQVQIEQDTAKSTHVGGEIQHDLNRAGMPLLEIVSLPDLSSPEEAGEYVRTLQAVLRSVAVSDGMMEAGSLRCDVNVSMHREGEPLGTRTELKNLSSIKTVVQAINAEARRQFEILTSTVASTDKPEIWQQTLTFDENTFLTRPIRTKEGIDDYRYMPDPNLPPLLMEKDALNALKIDMATQGMAGPTMPSGEISFGWEGIKQRLEVILGLPHSDVSDDQKMKGVRRDLEVLMMLDAGKTVGWDGMAEPGTASFFERVVGDHLPNAGNGTSGSSRNPRVVLNWMIHDLLGQLTQRDETFAHNSISPEQLGEIIDAIEEARITTTGGKKLLRHLLDTRQQAPSPSPDPISAALSDPNNALASQTLSISDLIERLGISKSSSMADLDRWCQEVVNEYPDLAGKVNSGKQGVLMFLVGQVMKRSQGTADALQAKKILEKKLIG